MRARRAASSSCSTRENFSGVSDSRDAIVALLTGNDTVMTGRIDEISDEVSHGSHTLSLSGRDGAAVLLDCSAPVFVASLVVWGLIQLLMGLRVSEEDEYEGVDIAECGLEAYPEFTRK